MHISPLAPLEFHLGKMFTARTRMQQQACVLWTYHLAACQVPWVNRHICRRDTCWVKQLSQSAHPKEGFGAVKYLLATTFGFSANATVRLCLSEGSKTVSGKSQTYAKASSTGLGLLAICRTTLHKLLIKNCAEVAELQMLCAQGCGRAFWNHVRHSAHPCTARNWQQVACMLEDLAAKA